MSRESVAFFTTIDLAALNGPTIHVYNLVNGLAHLGHDVTIVAPRPSGPQVMTFAPTIKVVETRSTLAVGLPRAASAALMVAALWRHRRDDAIYLRTSLGTILLALAANLFGARTIVVETNGWLADELRSMRFPSPVIALAEAAQQWEARHAARVRVVTDNLAAKMATKGLPRDRVAVIPTGTDTSTFRPQDRDTARHALGLRSDGLYLVFIGNLWPAIDLATVFAAMAELRRTGQNFELLVIGDGTGRDTIQRQAHSILGSDSPVHFLGARPPAEANVALNAADIAVAPFTRARNESTGLSPLKIRDYAASGAMVVASDVAGIRELGHEPWLELAAPEDPASFAAAVLRAISNDTASARKRARELAEKQFDWSRIVADVSVLISAACRARRKPH